jgi:hypothetical protein
MGLLKRNIFILPAAALIALSLAGCVYNVSYLVKNSRLADVETVFKDYSGLSGYNMTYANDQTGAYRIVVSSAVVPSSLPGAVPSGVPGERMRPPVERKVASLAIQMAQEGDDVTINAQSTGNLDAGDQFNAFLDYLRGKGYTVQELKQSN